MRGHAEGQAAATKSTEGSTVPAVPTNRLLKLQSMAGNAAVVTMVQRLSDAGTPAASDAGTAVDPKLDAIEARYRSIIGAGRGLGWTVAADNLQFWLDNRNSSVVRPIDITWLRSYHAVTSAESTNEDRFEGSLKKQAVKLADGATTTFSDHWDRALTPAITTELYYASGTSEVSSKGTFTLSRNGRTVTITGTVHHRWHDRYDWNSGQGVYLPGYGGVSDDDALALRRAGRGADYDMLTEWDRACSGTADIGTLYDSISLTWTGP